LAHASRKTHYLVTASSHSQGFCRFGLRFLGRFLVPVRLISVDFLGFRAFRTLKFI